MRTTGFEFFQLEPGDFREIIVSRLENGKFIITVPIVQTSRELEESEINDWVLDNMNTNVVFRFPYG